MSSLFGEHTTQDGTMMGVDEMTVTHLENYINLRVRQMQQVKNEVARNEFVSEWERELSGKPKRDVQSAARLIRTIFHDLRPYIARAWVLGIVCPAELSDVLYGDIAPPQTVLIDTGEEIPF